MRIKLMLFILSAFFIQVNLYGLDTFKIKKEPGNIPVKYFDSSVELNTQQDDDTNDQDNISDQDSIIDNLISEGILQPTPVVDSNGEPLGVYTGTDSSGNKVYKFYPEVDVPDNSIMNQDTADSLLNDIANYASRYGYDDEWISKEAKDFVEKMKVVEPEDFKSWSGMGSTCSANNKHRVKFSSLSSMPNTCSNPSWPTIVLCTDSYGAGAYRGADPSLGYGCAG